MRILSYVCIALLGLLSSCGKTQKDVCEVPEFFITERRASLNVDSVAVWHANQDRNWLVATAKSGHVLPVLDAVTGAHIKDIGEPGTGIGQLQRPNGIAIVDNLVFITERENKRLQVFSLPDGKSLGVTEGVMHRPYGIAVMPDDKGYTVYVTDNFNQTGPLAPKFVHIYRVIPQSDSVDISLVKTFGDQQGAGALIKVESIAIDKEHNRLLIADEHKTQKNIKIYTLDGQFTGQVIGDGLFAYEPEGIALYHTGPKTGYIVATDQDRIGNQFYVFDRENLAHIGTFKGKEVRNTDGIAITERAFGPFKAGAFYAVHDDGNICAYDWQEIVRRCGFTG